MKRINWNAVPWLIIVIAILIAIAFFAVRGCKTQKEKTAEISDIVSIKADTVAHWQDEQSRDHGTTRLSEADIVTLKQYYPALVDSLRRMLRIKDKQLQAVHAVSVITAGEVRPIHDTVRIGDSSYNRWSYAGRFLRFEGIATDPPVVRYETFDSLIVTTYWKRKNIFSRKEVFVDAVSLNPNARISGMTSLRVAVEKPKHLSVGAFMGYGTNGKEWAPVVGAGVQISIFSF